MQSLIGKWISVLIVITFIALSFGVVNNCKSKKSSKSNPPPAKEEQTLPKSPATQPSSDTSKAFCEEFTQKYIVTRKQSPLSERQRYVKECDPYYGGEDYRIGGSNPSQK